MPKNLKNRLLEKVKTARRPELTTRQFADKRRAFEISLNLMPEPYGHRLYDVFQEFIRSEEGQNIFLWIPSDTTVHLTDEKTASADIVENRIYIPKSSINDREMLLDMYTHENKHLEQKERGLYNGESADCNPEQLFIQNMVLEAHAYISGTAFAGKEAIDKAVPTRSLSYKKTLLTNGASMQFLDFIRKNNEYGKDWRRYYELNSLSSAAWHVRFGDVSEKGNSEFHKAVVDKCVEEINPNYLGTDADHARCWLSPENEKILNEINVANKAKKVGDFRPIAQIYDHLNQLRRERRE